MMSGFQLGYGPNQPCTLFLFPGWVMDNEAKYFAGCLGAFLIPVAIGRARNTRRGGGDGSKQREVDRDPL